jgi:hypothetical protein
MVRDSRENPSRGTAQPGGDDEMPLPPGYYLEYSDPDVLTLRSAEGAVVARFSAMANVAESIVVREAWKDFHRQRNGRPTPD